MADTAILIPAAVLVVWTMIMAIWMLIHRAGLFRKYNMSLDKLPPGARGADFAAAAPGVKDWVAHNYNHLMEQPTVFYAVVIILFLTGGTQTDLYLAWAYVGIRVVHSLWQSVVNTIPVRLTLFTVSSILLAVLAVRALLATI